MKRLLLILASIPVTLACGLAGAEDIALSPGKMANLGIEFATPEVAREVAAVEATARVVIPPSGDAIISAPLPGLLAGLNVAVGEEVVAGQALAKLQSPDFIALQREYLDALNTNLLAQSDLERDQQLLDEGIISGRRLQETSTRARIAATSLGEHRQLLRIAGLSDPDIEALRTGQQLVRQLSVRAPFSGVILERMATVGERMDAMSPVFRLADLSTLWLEINVPQEKVGLVATGMKVSVEGAEVPFPATVTAVGRSIDPATQTIIVRATLDDRDHGLSPGQFASVRIVGEAAGSTVNEIWTVPVAAVTERGSHSYIFVRTPSGFDVRNARVVSRGADFATLAVELAPSDQVVVAGVATLKALWASQSETDS